MGAQIDKKGGVETLAGAQSDALRLFISCELNCELTGPVVLNKIFVGVHGRLSTVQNRT